MAIQFTVRVPEPDEPAIHTWNPVVDSLWVFNTAIPDVVALFPYETTTTGFALNAVPKVTVDQETPVKETVPYCTLNGSLAAGTVPDVIFAPE